MHCETERQVHMENKHQEDLLNNEKEEIQYLKTEESKGLSTEKNLNNNYYNYNSNNAFYDNILHTSNLNNESFTNNDINSKLNLETEGDEVNYALTEYNEFTPDIGQKQVNKPKPKQKEKNSFIMKVRAALEFTNKIRQMHLNNNESNFSRRNEQNKELVNNLMTHSKKEVSPISGGITNNTNSRFNSSTQQKKLKNNNPYKDYNTSIKDHSPIANLINTYFEKKDHKNVNKTFYQNSEKANIYDNHIVNNKVSRNYFNSNNLVSNSIDTSLGSNILKLEENKIISKKQQITESSLNNNLTKKDFIQQLKISSIPNELASNNSIKDCNNESDKVFLRENSQQQRIKNEYPQTQDSHYNSSSTERNRLKKQSKNSASDSEFKSPEFGLKKGRSIIKVKKENLGGNNLTLSSEESEIENFNKFNNQQTFKKNKKNEEIEDDKIKDKEIINEGNIHDFEDFNSYKRNLLLNFPNTTRNKNFSFDENNMIAYLSLKTLNKNKNNNSNKQKKNLNLKIFKENTQHNKFATTEANFPVHHLSKPKGSHQERENKFFSEKSNSPSNINILFNNNNNHYNKNNTNKNNNLSNNAATSQIEPLNLNKARENKKKEKKENRIDVDVIKNYLSKEPIDNIITNKINHLSENNNVSDDKKFFRDNTQNDSHASEKIDLKNKDNCQSNEAINCINSQILGEQEQIFNGENHNDNNSQEKMNNIISCENDFCKESIDSKKISHHDQKNIQAQHQPISNSSSKCSNISNSEKKSDNENSNISGIPAKKPNVHNKVFSFGGEALAKIKEKNITNSNNPDKINNRDSSMQNNKVNKTFNFNNGNTGINHPQAIDAIPKEQENNNKSIFSVKKENQIFFKNLTSRHNRNISSPFIKKQSNGDSINNNINGNNKTNSNITKPSMKKLKKPSLEINMNLINSGDEENDIINKVVSESTKNFNQPKQMKFDFNPAKVFTTKNNDKKQSEYTTKTKAPISSRREAIPDAKHNNSDVVSSEVNSHNKAGHQKSSSKDNLKTSLNFGKVTQSKEKESSKVKHKLNNSNKNPYMYDGAEHVQDNGNDHNASLSFNAEKKNKNCLKENNKIKSKEKVKHGKIGSNHKNEGKAREKFSNHEENSDKHDSTFEQNGVENIKAEDAASQPRKLLKNLSVINENEDGEKRSLNTTPRDLNFKFENKIKKNNILNGLDTNDDKYNNVKIMEIANTHKNKDSYNTNFNGNNVPFKNKNETKDKPKKKENFKHHKRISVPDNTINLSDSNNLIANKREKSKSTDKINTKDKAENPPQIIKKNKISSSVIIEHKENYDQLDHSINNNKEVPEIKVSTSKIENNCLIPNTNSNMYKKIKSNSKVLQDHNNKEKLNMNKSADFIKNPTADEEANLNTKNKNKLIKKRSISQDRRFSFNNINNFQDTSFGEKDINKSNINNDTEKQNNNNNIPCDKLDERPKKPRRYSSLVAYEGQRKEKDQVVDKKTNKNVTSKDPIRQSKTQENIVEVKVNIEKNNNNETNKDNPLVESTEESVNNSNNNNNNFIKRNNLKNKPRHSFLIGKGSLKLEDNFGSCGEAKEIKEKSMSKKKTAKNIQFRKSRDSIKTEDSKTKKIDQNQKEENEKSSNAKLRKIIKPSSLKSKEEISDSNRTHDNADNNYTSNPMTPKNIKKTTARINEVSENDNNINSNFSETDNNNDDNAKIKNIDELIKKVKIDEEKIYNKKDNCSISKDEAEINKQNKTGDIPGMEKINDTIINVSTNTDESNQLADHRNKNLGNLQNIEKSNMINLTMTPKFSPIEFLKNINTISNSDFNDQRALGELSSDVSNKLGLNQKNKLIIAEYIANLYKSRRSFGSKTDEILFFVFNSKYDIFNYYFIFIIFEINLNFFLHKY